ncbi:hypothetical protein MBANPS3_005516 [Mucor bainieri]
MNPYLEPKTRQKILYYDEDSYYEGDIEYRNQLAASLKLEPNDDANGIDYEIISRFHNREAVFQLFCTPPGGHKANREGDKHLLKPGASVSGTIRNADQNGHSKLCIDGNDTYEYRHTLN